MEEVKHTPGPWTVGAKDRPSRDMSVYTSINGVTVSIAYCDLNSSYSTCVSNARLIAAAPELLDAHEPDRAGPEFLNWVADRLVMHGDNQNSDFVLCLRRRSEKAKAAIAKAIGKK